MVPKSPKPKKEILLSHIISIVAYGGGLKCPRKIRKKSNRSVIVQNNKFSECITENKLNLFIFFRNCRRYDQFGYFPINFFLLLLSD